MDKELATSLQTILRLKLVCGDFELNYNERLAVMRLSDSLELILHHLTQDQQLYLSKVLLATEHNDGCIKIVQLLFNGNKYMNHPHERQIRLNAAYALAILGEYSNSISSLETIFQLSDIANKDSVYFDAKEAKAHCLVSLNKPREAFVLHQEVLKYRSKRNLLKTAAKSNISIAKIYIKNSEYKPALDCLKDAVSTLTPLEDGLTLAYGLIEMSKLQKHMCLHSDAEFSLNRARIICESIKSDRGVGLVMITSVEFAIELLIEDSQNSKDKLETAIKCFENVGDFRRLKKAESLLTSCNS